jgi:hypothetical protein
VLFADPGVEWAGQDLGEHGCLFWSERPAAQLPDRDVADLVARDVGRLVRWVDGETAPGPLARVRAEHAVELLDRGLARQQTARSAASGTVPYTALRRQREAVTTLRDRLLSRLDADADRVELQVGASLQACEQHLRAGVGPHLHRLRFDELSGRPLQDAVSAYLREGLKAWHDEAVGLVEDRLSRDATATDDLLDTVDWNVVNGAVATGGYPQRLAQRLSPQVREGVPRLQALSGPAAPTGGGLLTPALRSLAYGGLAVTTSLVAIGPLWLPATVIAATAAAGGSAVDHRLSRAHARDAAEAWAKDAISATVNDLARDVRQSLRAARDPIRRSIAAAFTELLTALSAAGQARPEEPTSRGGDADRAAVAALRTVLTEAVSPPHREGARDA